MLFFRHNGSNYRDRRTRISALVPARIFLSYSNSDGAEYATTIRRWLESQGFSIWLDIVALEGKTDWWTQIELALRSKDLHHLVLIVTPGALASRVVRDEIRLAKQEGKTVSPIRGPGIDDLSIMPRWLGNIYDIGVAERRVNLIRVLEAPSMAKRVLMMAPEPPSDFVARPREYKTLKAQLLHPNTSDAVAITAALRGAGGYGKTTLARALAHDSDVQDAYYDGVLWVELGEHGDTRLLAVLTDIATLVTGETRSVTTIEAARTMFADALGNRRILLVIDDVWKKGHLEPFLHGGPSTTRLITTRFDNELPVDAIRQVVDSMEPSEALTLIGWGLPPDQVAKNTAILSAMAKYLGEWAQLLKLTNGFLRRRVNTANGLLIDAIADVNSRLQSRGFTALDDRKAQDYGTRHDSVYVVMNNSLDLLDDPQRERFSELGIFPEDTDIPIGIVAHFWKETAGLDLIATEDLLTDCVDLSLLLSLDFERRTLRLHDTTRHFLRDQAGKANLMVQHERLIQGMSDVHGTEMPAQEMGYFYRYLPSHLYDAGKHEELNALLVDPDWLNSKITATKKPSDLIADYQQFGRGELHVLIGRTLRLTANMCLRDPHQLLPQLIGRMVGIRTAAAEYFVKEARRVVKRPALIPENSNLILPGVELSRLEGHTAAVLALAVLPDGRLVSGSKDNTIRLWDLQNGVEAACLKGHTGAVSVLALLPDGKLASGSYDTTIRLWDLQNNVEAACLEGHTGAVLALAVLPDGRLASGARDNVIRLWSLRNNLESGFLLGHSDRVNALAVIPGARGDEWVLASGSGSTRDGRDMTIRVWDPRTGNEIAHLTDNRGAGGLISTLAVLPINDAPAPQLLSGDFLGNVRLWDLVTGAETMKIKPTNNCVSDLAVLQNGDIASSNHWHNRIRILDPRSGTETAQLDGHSDQVNALAVLPDGRLASSSDDKTIRLWDPLAALKIESESQKDGHADVVLSLAILPGGKLASGSSDDTIRLWDTNSMSETACIRTNIFGWQPANNSAFAVLPNGRLASGARDSTIRIWDIEDQLETACLPGRSGTVTALAVLEDGRLASGTEGQTRMPGEEGPIIEIWDLKDNRISERLVGPEYDILALANFRNDCLVSSTDDGKLTLWNVKTGTRSGELCRDQPAADSLLALSDGRLVSGSRDGVLRLWDLATGMVTHRLVGHTGFVNAIVPLSNGRLASAGGDRTIRCWDLCSYSEITCLDMDMPILSLAATSDNRFVAGDQLGRLHWLEIWE